MLVSKLKYRIYDALKHHRIFYFDIEFNDNVSYVTPNTDTICIKKQDFEKMVADGCHELLHIVLDHFPRGKRITSSNETWVIWNIATDIVINRMLNELGIEMPVIEVPVQGSSEVIYRYLLQHSGVQSFGNNKYRVDIGGKSITVKITTDSDTPEDVDIIIPSKDNVPSEYTYQACNWKYASTQSETYKREVQAIETPLSLEHLSNVVSTIKDKMDDVSFLKYGTLDLVLNLDIKLPVWIDNKIKGVIAIDTSGSITKDELAKFIGILQSNRKCFTDDSKVIFIDTKIRKTITLDELDSQIKVSGGGGTLYDEAFHITKEDDYDLLIYLTDLCPARWPDYDRSFDVIWVVQYNQFTVDITPPYGTVIYF